jgi:hypothetical protein
MQEFQTRVVTEKSELDTKLAVLHKFMETNTFFQLLEAEQERMKRQSRAMKDYSDVLGERISNFK